MIEDLFLGKIELFSQKFKSLYLSAVSYYDMADSEKYYHHFISKLFFENNLTGHFLKNIK